ncbi:hypothetical protein BO78DRAFT_194265 [Aspergillus sclerotiicarbonarius CBS 121057]|uniref:Uncharacterized protein n=1 Tax=Aspergillus sclerotiicarbonarius (strain CBS 121057 / IBT 28362) TaxID=1448318 RepID=A0A319E1V6_ASPSB|nr:hypothetical protein BO78DRAFT_194265 [Aspergillus sclerotiicarbonarius CBS 121057]
MPRNASAWARLNPTNHFLLFSQGMCCQAAGCLWVMSLIVMRWTPHGLAGTALHDSALVPDSGSRPLTGWLLSSGRVK